MQFLQVLSVDPLVFSDRCVPRLFSPERTGIARSIEAKCSTRLCLFPSFFCIWRRIDSRYRAVLAPLVSVASRHRLICQRLWLQRAVKPCALPSAVPRRAAALMTGLVHFSRLVLFSAGFHDRSGEISICHLFPPFVRSLCSISCTRGRLQEDGDGPEAEFTTEFTIS